MPHFNCTCTRHECTRTHLFFLTVGARVGFRAFTLVARVTCRAGAPVLARATGAGVWQLVAVSTGPSGLTAARVRRSGWLQQCTRP